MMQFLAQFNPDPVFFKAGPITLYWYGLILVAAMIGGIMSVLSLGKRYGLPVDRIFDIAFWLIVWGIVGARFYHVFLEYDYYINQPIAIFKLWQGGLAIHGAILAGIGALILLARKYRLDFWQMASILAVGLSLGQAIGRWGNYFNQELFGYPTTLPWAIAIEPKNRPLEFAMNKTFHPVFLYESIGCLVIFLFLSYFHRRFMREKRADYKIIFLIYLGMYAILRFFTESMRVDPAHEILGLRFPQVVSLIIVVPIAFVMLKRIYKKSRQS